MSKGGVSFPMILVVTLIIAAIVLAVAVYFIVTSKESIEVLFADSVKSIQRFFCGLFGPAGSLICAGIS